MLEPGDSATLLLFVKAGVAIFTVICLSVLAEILSPRYAGLAFCLTV